MEILLLLLKLKLALIVMFMITGIICDYATHTKDANLDGHC